MAIVLAPTQHNTKEENEVIKAVNPPVENWSDTKKCQKDTETCWTQKRGKNYFGYKDNIEVCVQQKIIRDYKITNTVGHDSNVFEDIFDETNTSRDVYVCRACRSVEYEANLNEKKFRPRLQRKRCKGRQLTS